jgi:hypothetical protein
MPREHESATAHDFKNNLSLLRSGQHQTVLLCYTRFTLDPGDDRTSRGTVRCVCFRTSGTALTPILRPLRGGCAPLTSPRGSRLPSALASRSRSCSIRRPVCGRPACSTTLIFATLPLLHRPGPLAAPLAFSITAYVVIFFNCLLMGAGTGMQFYYLAITALVICS